MKWKIYKLLSILFPKKYKCIKCGVDLSKGIDWQVDVYLKYNPSTKSYELIKTISYK